MLKLMVFSWNGVLFPDAAAGVESNNHVMGFYGGEPITLGKMRETHIIPASEFYAKQGIRRELLESKAAEMSERFHDYYEKRAGKIRSRQGARSVLEWLARKGVESIILSNHTMEGMQAQLKRLKLNGLIDEVVANPTRGISFKRRNRLEKLEGYLKTHRCKPNEVATIGDSPEEVEIGKKAGIKTIAISQGYCSTKRLKAAKPDFLIRSLKELPAILMRI